jgi:hypothetical protein
MFEVIAYEILVEAVTPIAHASESLGNHSIVMRRKTRLPGGGWANVPIITGDTMRHGLREAAAYAFLDAAGMLDKADLSEAALRLLFTGGMVTGRGDAANIKMDDYRDMVDLVPPLALLGGCASNRVVPGRLVSEDAVLVCEEAKALVPAWTVERAGVLSGARAHLEIAQRVRMDATLDPGKRKLLATGATAKLEAKTRRSEAAAEADDAIAREESKSTMLPRTFEAVASGSLFSWRVQATCMSELDRDTFHAMIGAFLSNARVGGKRGVGCGLLRAVAANAITVHRPAEAMRPVDPSALGPRVGEVFRTHVRQRADRARAFLAEVNA